jgi:hypothetical protein
LQPYVPERSPTCAGLLGLGLVSGLVLPTDGAGRRVGRRHRDGGRLAPEARQRVCLPGASSSSPRTTPTLALRPYGPRPAPRPIRAFSQPTTSPLPPSFHLLWPFTTILTPARVCVLSGRCIARLQAHQQLRGASRHQGGARALRLRRALRRPRRAVVSEEPLPRPQRQTGSARSA